MRVKTDDGGHFSVYAEYNHSIPLTYKWVGVDSLTPRSVIIGIFNNRSLLCSDYTWEQREITDGALSSRFSFILLLVSLLVFVWYN